MVTIHNVRQGTDEWLAMRDGLYTGSNAHKILRAGKIDWSKSTVQEWSGNEFTRRGHEMEERALRMYERIYGVDVLRVGFVTNDKYPDCGYSPDGIVGDTLLEVKSFNGDKHDAVKKYVNFEIRAQIEFGKCICELKKAQLILCNLDLPAEDALVIVDIQYVRAIQQNLHRILRA